MDNLKKPSELKYEEVSDNTCLTKVFVQGDDMIFPQIVLQKQADLNPQKNFVKKYLELLRRKRYISFKTATNELRKSQLWLLIASESIDKPKIKQYKESSYSSDDWIFYGQMRSPKSALAPKIKSFQNTADQQDMDRLIQKKINELKRYDISVILHSCYKVLPTDLIPLDYILTRDSHQFGIYGEGHFLPINLFDDNISETRTPTEWLDSASVNGINYCVPAKAFIPWDTSNLDRAFIAHDWEDVGVYDYDTKNEMYFVLPANLDRGPFRITRLLICFKGESTLNAAKRIAQAVNLRNYAENSIRYNALIDFTPKEPCPSYDLDSMFSLLNKITRNGKLRVFDKPLRYLVTFYKKVLTNLYIQDIVKKYPDIFNYIYVPVKNVWVPPETEKPVGITDIKQRQDYLRRHWIYSNPGVWQIIMTATAECAKSSEYNIFAIEQCNYVPLEEFVRLQEHFQSTFMSYMLGDWKNVIINKVHEVLGDFGRGHYNLNQNDWTCYRNSKIPRILGLIRFIMERALNVNLRRNITSYVNMFEAASESTFLLNKYFKWGDSIVASPFVPLIKPIFAVELHLSETGAYYSTPLELFEAAITSKLDKAIRDTHTIERLGRTVNVNLRYSKEFVYFTSIGFQEPPATDALDRLQRAIRCAIIPIVAYAKEYDRFLPLFNLNVDEYIEKYSEENHPPYEVREEIESHLRAKERLKLIIPESIVIGPFSIKTSNIKNCLMKKREELITKQLKSYSLKMMDKMYAATHEYMTIFRKLSDRPVSVEQIIEIREWIETIPMTVKGQQEIIKKILQDYELLDLYWWPLEDEEFETKWTAITWPHKINNKIAEVNKTLSEEWGMFQKLHVDNELTIQDKIETITGNIAQLSIQDNIARVHEIAVDVRKTWKMLRETIDFGHVLNQRQKIFGLPVTTYDDVQKLLRDFEPFKNLWGTASDWLKLSEILLSNPLVNVEDDNLDFEISEYHKTMIKCTRTFTDYPACLKIAQDIKGQIDEFKPLIPVLHALKNAGMRKRHWDDFNDASGLKVQMTPILSLSKCISGGILEYADELVKISDMAGKEYTIEQSLDKMENEWKTSCMSVTPYKLSGTYIMRVTDEQLQLLDDQIAATQQLSFSPFKGPFEERIGEWEAKLRLAQAVIEEWAECQRQWMYLESIFASEDISSQLPFESKKFSVVSRSWERIMRAAFDNNLIMSICPNKRILEQLKTNNYALEVVQKGLAEYLEMKRLAFPRFFFLSDDELLEILAQARNPLAVQPHMRKCFENIKSLTFLDDLCITQMHSAEGECVDMIPTMYPTGTVEAWLLRVEENMKNTLKVNVYESMQTIEMTPRAKWVLEWPGQIVIAGCQAYWTAHVEDSINRKHIQGYYDVMLEHLDTLRNLVRGPLKRVERQVLSALIVIEVHARDVTFNLMDLNVSNVNEFDWISQLRYYLVEIDLKVRAVNAEFQYGYEYLGNSGRLVITPLTDRCYLTLTGALHLKFGGAPAGPAGTGKTETTKDLAKAFAIQCVVFNCSDQLDFMAMGKFFKGLASSGAWACFDEFNRIDIEVLSVIAQQIMTIQKAQITRAERFMFEGTELKLNPTAAVFITMNPGYAGRTELPDNLKALFRPVAMMVPDYTLIAEISLFSFGFSNAKGLAGKITSTFKLSSEQLSSQDHYDFGMRAVKTVITVAGNLKREHPNMDESQIIWRSLKDVNVPKFLVNDLKLFSGIVSDLFPRLVEEAIDYGKLELAIRQSLIEFGLEDVDDYVKKVIQLYETTVVRHGLMLVGPTGSGKTKCYEVLKEAMTSLTGQPSPSGYPFQRVWTYVLNPKSITMGQLYGEFDLMTHEWTDGILPSMVRTGANSTDSDKRWYVFDGPVDAVWIENMNTVLDDNKKLCLTSGEIIKLSEHMTMMFEVADLAVASPATVSRCGMVYLEPSVLGLQPYINCWINRLPELARHLAYPLRELLNIYLLPGIDFLRNSLRELVTSIDSAIVLSFFKLMDCFLLPLTSPGGKPPPSKPSQSLMPSLITPWSMFSLVWSVGGTSDSASREKFTNWLDTTMREHKHEPLFPDGNGFNYRLYDGGFTTATEEADLNQPAWIYWMQNVESFLITIDTKYSDIEIPTIDNVRSADVIGTLLGFNTNVLCIGPTGTGKTLTVLSKLNKNMPKKFICDFINFSARTSSNQTQDLIESKLEKRRRGVLGPPLLKQMIIFIDDFNMPALETYGAQPPIELIRQWMDFGGWYNRRLVGEFRKLIDINFIAAMGPPGGGRNPVTPRLLRHFHFISFNELDKNSQETIFRKIISFWLDLTPSVSSFTEVLLSATLNVYSTIVQELLPTPAKTHYTFNLRDLSKVFQGIYMASPDNMLMIDDLVKLWVHENCRVFQDRLVNDEDRVWFDELLDQQLIDVFHIEPESVATIDSRTLLYGDFMTSENRIYAQITDMIKLSKILDDYLEEYNKSTTAPMRLVLFLDAISHICRIARIIRQPYGNALLFGMGGSGRQSLTRLATFLSDYTCFQIELSKSYGMNEWREDIKGIMYKAGIYSRETVFLFSDTQIKMESFLEDINNILNSGDVPNLYQLEELDKIYETMKAPVTDAGLLATKSNLFAFYLKAVRSNMHCVITMSPIGDVFRARLRQFPALVNCCTIDWFFPWPDAALQSVALQFLEDVPGLSASDELLENVVTICRFMHQSVINASGLFLQELSRHNYVTPTSFLELLSLYTSMLEKKKIEQETSINRLKTGLDKLLSTSEDVKIMQEELVALQPALEVAQKEALEMLAIIEADTEVAEQTKQVVQGEEAEAAKIAVETQNIADDAQRDLEEAMPALRAAESALQSLNRNDITEIRAMMRPPEGVKLVLEVVCIVKNIKPNKVAGAKLGEKVLDYWDPAKAMLADPQAFLNSLLFFDKENLTDAIINKIQPYIDNPEFRPAKIIKVSKACTSLCQWVHAMYQYYFVNQAVAPKKAKLKDAMEKLEVTERALAKSRGKMKKVMDGLGVLNEKLRETINKKEELERTWNLCQTRMKQAHRLVNGLVTERRRWLESLATMQRTLVNIIGDILISAGAVAYLAPFTDKYRRGLLAEWGELEAELAVPHTPGCDPVSTLGDLVTIRKWQVDGLPRDYFSTESSVLVAQSRRWPLFIDPQGQANKWIKNTYKGENLVVAKLNDKDLMRRIEGAISFGKTVILENVGQDLDPSLDPILMKQTFMQGGQLWIKLGDSVVPYNSSFKLFLTTKWPNPHYTPEISIKVLVVNFMLVPSGLQDQLLALVAMEERPDLEETRARIVSSIAQGKSDLKELEDRILVKLSTSEGNPVDDIALIDSLEESKVMSEDIRERVDNAAKTQDIIDQIRSEYIPVARRAQILYFCLADLAKVDPMYQYSLEWFTKIFINSMAKTEKNCEVIERIEIINDHFTFSLYTNVCRSMFEKNKLQFAFLIAVRILLDSGFVELDEYNFFLAGASPLRNLENPAKAWLGVRSWTDILSLENLDIFKGFIEHFLECLDAYKVIVDSKEPEKEKLSGEWEEKLNNFQKMVILKCLRPDKVTNAMQFFVSDNLGSQFIEPQSTELEAMYRESSTTVPLIFVLSTGTDPASDFYKFAEKLRMGKRIMSISLGQGQGPIAEKLFVEAMDIGSWVFFQNCHLAPSWMPRMEYLVENIPGDTCHKDFRLWVTSTPSPDFPVSILQNGSKLTIEPPRGVKANLLRAYSSQITEFSDFINSEDPKVQGFKHLLFSLCLFHGVCLERRKYGALGFNIPYEFTDGDLRICISQLYMFVREYKDIPFKVLLYTAGEINYGGRVTDDWDRRCIMNILSDFYHPTVLSSNHAFSEDAVYHQLKAGSEIIDYVEYVKTLPVNDKPGLFGLHENADISYAQGETYRSLSALLSLQPRATGGASSDQESSIVNIAKSVQSRVPKPFKNVNEIEEKYPVLYEESLNTVLVQEIIRYNKLLSAIHTSISNLLKAIQGIIVMSDDLEKMSASLSTNKVPQMWASKAYPSLKPLGAWVADLQERVHFINIWINKGIPPSFWVPGFYFPQAFLTGCLQNYARKYIVAIDTLSYKFKVLKVSPSVRPKDGCVVYGLYLEGARWSSDQSLLRESRPKELYTEMAPIWFIPEALHKKGDGLYNCPVYKTLQRAGTLSTTGHSTNYVVAIEVPTNLEQKHWIKRGVALFCALDY